MMRHVRSRLAAASAVAAASLTLGLACSEDGPTPARVWGEVSYDGKAVDDGKITLTPTGETPGGSVAGPIKEGRYDIPASEGPFVGGTYRVEVSMLAKKGKSLPNVVDPGGPSLAVFEELIPPVYNGQSTLSLAVDKDASKNQHDFALKKPVGR